MTDDDELSEAIRRFQIFQGKQPKDMTADDVKDLAMIIEAGEAHLTEAEVRAKWLPLAESATVVMREMYFNPNTPDHDRQNIVKAFAAHNIPLELKEMN